MKNTFKYLILIVLLFSSCNKYEKLLKSPDAEMKYRKAVEYYNTADYDKALGLFESIMYFMRGTKKSDTVSYYTAMCYFKLDDYISSAEYFKDFSKTYSRSTFVEECDYMAGYCYYLMSPKPSLDQEFTIQSIDAFDYFLYKHPESKFVADCQRLRAELKDKLIEKDFNSATLYFNIESYKPAIIALRNCINKYPDTKYREEIMYMLVKSSYYLANNSIIEKKRDRFQSTIDEYYAFNDEFPNSKFKAELEKIFEKTKIELGI